MDDNQLKLIINLVEGAELIGDRFSNFRFIDHGFFSVLFSADDNLSKGRVAVKFLDPFLQDSYRRESFEREAALLWDFRGQRDIVCCVSERCDHVIYADFGIGSQVPFQLPFYSMELGNSGVHRALLTQDWTPERKLEVFGAMCRAIQRIHTAGVVHRDLKPDNFLVMPESEIKLADFGTARRITDTPLDQQYERFPGDRAYSAPELVALLHDADPQIAMRSDIFSLGAILFEMFTGSKMGFLLFTQQYYQSLLLPLQGVPHHQRANALDELLPSLSEYFPVPRISEHCQTVPASIVVQLDRLCGSMTMLDYRRRMTDFATIFRQLSGCINRLRYQSELLRLQAFRERRQANRAARKAAVAAKGFDR